MTNDLEIIEKISLMAERNLVIYGAGMNGRKAKKWIDEMGINHISRFCDSSPAKWGDHIDGVAVISPEELEGYCKEYTSLIIVSSDYEVEIIEGLKGLKLHDALVCSRTGFFLAIRFNLNSDMINQGFKNRFMRYCEIERVFLNQDIMYNDVLRARYWLEQDLEEDKPVLILQPGKVGSSTLFHSLWNEKIWCVQVHEVKYKKHMFAGEYEKIYNDYLREARVKPVRVISLVREPIKRDISCFWDLIRSGCFIYNDFLDRDICGGFEKYLDYAYNRRDEIDKMVPGEKGILWWGPEFDWFKEELEPALGIDIYQYPFNKEKGFVQIKEGNMNLLVLTLEKLGDNLDIIKDFLGLEHLELSNSNQANDTEYRYIYEEFHQRLTLKRDYLDYYYKGNPHMDYFYTKEDQERFLCKWQQKCL